MNLNFYKNKKVLITGHTGFKGTWLCKILLNAGAIVTGFSLQPKKNDSFFYLSNIDTKIKSIFGDIRDFNKLNDVFLKSQPEFVFHLAAQPLVLESYENPLYTYETNVMGTVNLLECIRLNNCVKSVVNITTDKVYKNNEWIWAYREDEVLNGYDPYSNSKSCSELVTDSYIKSFFSSRDIAISTARAGNVIGGGDFSENRIIPDCVRAVSQQQVIIIRNPDSIRPYQHVLEPLIMYLTIAKKQYMDISLSDNYNIGPDDSDCITTEALVALFCKYWGANASWQVIKENNAMHEANLLKLDCSKIKKVYKWKPRWDINKCIKMTVDFNKILLNNGDIASEMDLEISEFLKDNNT